MSTDMVAAGRIFNTSVANNTTDFFATALTPKFGRSVFRVGIAVGTATRLDARLSDGTTTVALQLNGGTNLAANEAYWMEFPVTNGETVNFRHSDAGAVTILYMVVDEVRGGLVGGNTRSDQSAVISGALATGSNTIGLVGLVSSNLSTRIALPAALANGGIKAGIVAGSAVVGRVNVGSGTSRIGFLTANSATIGRVNVGSGTSRIGYLLANSALIGRVNLNSGTATLGRVNLGSGTSRLGYLLANSALVGRVNLNSATNLRIGQVGGKTVRISPTSLKVQSNTAYAANDQVNSGTVAFANLARTSGVGGLIKHIHVVDLSKQSLGLNLLLFASSYTVGAANAAFDPSDTDLANSFAAISITASDYQSYNDNSVATKEVSIALPPALSANTHYMAIQTTGAPTYATQNDLKITICVLQD